MNFVLEGSVPGKIHGSANHIIKRLIFMSSYPR